MIDDLFAITKYSVLFIGSFYGYFKLSKIKLKLINLLDIIVAVILATALCYATKQLRLLVPIGFLILTFVYIFLRYRRNVLSTATTAIISCGITIITMIVAMLISMPLDFFAFRFIENATVRDVATRVIICVVQLIIIFLFYRIKRFKSGIFIQNNDGNIELLLLISILCIILMTLFYTDNLAGSPSDLIILTSIFCGLMLIIGWRKHITYNYQKYIYKRNEALYEKRIEDYEREREELLNQNAELSKIIHRDNKLIPAMLIAVKESIGDTHNGDLQNLLSQLEDLSSEHREAINSYQAKSNNLPKTEVIAVDAVLHYILCKAIQNHISFDVCVLKDSIDLLKSKVSDMNDLTTILCDLGENAINATKNFPESKILISFELSEDKSACICFYDNGPLFDKNVIASMGKKRYTTRKDDGGSGIGLMTLFEILNKYNASYCLDESQNKEFTKCVRLTFDDLHNVSFISK